ncbi:carbohydrate kinase, YjeF related protein [Halorubrum distributum JCM 9100]|uniref:Bifunctional NAD(P)H-hydrate repair enzyme n=2 Tax=Halorubrum distributum TaxID=29283 RepID=M0EV35_9EURY|nr:bifunctional ADP-dependent NAD(P)H-hydrate dehydratase/NAD(P)H-hydrate epimerase [Halorubrum distributum]ELZ51555.1 carbohydrate kinase, YjeF related protein [Halorubrum distributum JCM 9100]ELZ52323.1 carbohydrate kinase, YjeF related protein [Halorubrum distributum JCM 10118]
MITTDRMAAVDANAAALGVPRKQLMESSGNAVAREVRAVADPGATVALVCGRGNNGGDALVAARFLKGYDVTVSLLGRPEAIRTDIARENWDALESAEIPREAVADSRGLNLTGPDGDDPDVVVDAMLGSGISGGLREPERTAAAAINASDATVIAVDVPSGIDADTGDPTGGSGETSVDADEGAVAVHADRVVTFHDEKPGLDSLDAAVTVADIGIPAAAERFTGPGDLLGIDRDPDSHKGENGEVLVVGGGPYTGAPTLSALAALRAGADLVSVACPESVAGAVQGFSPNLIVRALPGDRVGPAHADRVASLAAENDVVVLGPGLGGGDGTEAFVREFLTAFEGRAVVDADALRVVPDVDTDAELICTPHQGELVGMGGETAEEPDERAELVREFAAELDHALLVKGAVDVIADADGARLNRTGNPGMTVGGTGDVLAGTVGALAAVTDPFRAAAVGAYVVGRAGDAAAEANGAGLVATDLPDRLPEAMRNE